MALTPLQEIFVLLEDEKEVPLFRLNRWGKQARGVISKLKKYDWITKVDGKDETFYKITEKGEKAVDKLLAPLKTTGKWDGRWRLVMFDIPESKRDVRDKLRRSLSKLGMGILQASVWISPNDIRKDITETVERLNLGTTLKCFEVTRNSTLDKTIIEKSWNLPELDDNYKSYILRSERILKSINKSPNARFTAKKLIFEYASILQKDPILPWEFRQNDNLRKRAHEVYQNLRKFAV